MSSGFFSNIRLLALDCEEEGGFKCPSTDESLCCGEAIAKYLLLIKGAHVVCVRTFTT
jgi:hypothetical protein